MDTLRGSGSTVYGVVFELFFTPQNQYLRQFSSKHASSHYNSHLNWCGIADKLVLIRRYFNDRNKLKSLFYFFFMIFRSHFGNLRQKLDCRKWYVITFIERCYNSSRDLFSLFCHFKLSQLK